MSARYHTMQELLELFPNNPTILDAVIKTEDHINRIAREGGKIMVSISGGSDSDIMLDMFERLGYDEGEVVYVWFDTGLEYDATKRHLKDLEAKYGIEIKPHKNNKGYLVVDLWQENKRKQKLLHRVVAEAFIPNPKNLLEVNHKDENPQNCCSANLEWCTRLYNMNYGTCGAKIAKAKGKCVKQCDPDGVVVNTSPSIMEAQRKTGISQGSIGDCLHGRRKRAGGYLWHYAK